MPFGESTILANIMNNIAAAGITDFVIVVGYQAQKIQEYLYEQNHRNYKISFVENSEWTRGNGISVLLAERETRAENFILSMSDHIVSPQAIKRIANASNAANLLLIDPRINSIFDIDDATKVQVEQNKITNIGKEISGYNAIDCGIFRLTPRFFESMRQQLEFGKESISAAVQGLIQNNDMEAIFMADDEYWIDIDTPDAYEYALNNFPLHDD